MTATTTAPIRNYRRATWGELFLNSMVIFRAAGVGTPRAAKVLPAGPLGQFMVSIEFIPGQWAPAFAVGPMKELFIETC